MVGEGFAINDELRNLIKGLTLKNACEHGGKAIEGPIISALLGRNPTLRPHVKELAKVVSEVVKEVNALPHQEQCRLLNEEFPELVEWRREKEEKKLLPPLPNVSKYKVVRTRFAPNPDFYIHLGNARPAILSSEYAKMYGGVMILRFEDTDPKIKTPTVEAYKQIREDLTWLGVEWHEEYIQSLRMSIYYGVAKDLISRGGAYVDLCSQEDFRKLKLERRACPHRNADPNTNLELFDKMLSGHFKEGEAVVRVKTDLNHPDPSVVDWVAFRIVDTSKHPHPIVGDRYVVWPTYNFAAGVDDHLMNVTHILRGREHSVNTLKQMFMYSHMGWTYPEVINLGRLNLEGLILSKSKIKSLIKENPDAFKGPEDIRFGTIASLRNRGIDPQTIRTLILEVGIKQTDASISWDNIAATNRKLIDNFTKRLMAVFNPVKMVVRNYLGPEEVIIPYHPDNASLGRRSVKLSVNDGTLYVMVESKDVRALKVNSAVRLMELCNVRVTAINKDLIEAEFIGRDLTQARELRLPIIHWVSTDVNVHLEVLKPEGLEINVLKAVGEKELSNLTPGDRVQLVRFGFIKIADVIKTSTDYVNVKSIYIHD